MPKSIVIEPERVFASETIHFTDIPVNAYRKTVKEELAEYSPADLLDIWQDMCAIREFETVLNEIKNSPLFDSDSEIPEGRIDNEEAPGVFSFKVVAKLKRPLKL